MSIAGKKELELVEGTPAAPDPVSSSVSQVSAGKSGGGVGAVVAADEPILVVDSDMQIGRSIVRLLELHGYACVHAADAAEARRRLEIGSYGLILCDVKIPGGSGLDLVRDVVAEHPDIAAMMISGLDDAKVAAMALELGAYGYIIKPVRPSELLSSVANALRRRRLEFDNRAYQEQLEHRVLDRTAALLDALARLEHSGHELQRSREEMIRRLSRTVEFRDDASAGHIERIGHYCALAAHRLHLDAERSRAILLASPLHDVGKVAIPDRILRKPGKLTPEERAEMERHTEVGHSILSGSGTDLLEVAATIAWSHHEKFDGSGYPRGLAGTQIPLEGRITAIADVFDSLTSYRAYRPAFSLDEALAILQADRGGHFDPDVLDVFLESTDELCEIRSGTSELVLLPTP